MAATKTEIMAVFDSLCKILICYSCHKDSPPFGWLSFSLWCKGSKKAAEVAKLPSKGHIKRLYFQFQESSTTHIFGLFRHKKKAADRLPSLLDGITSCA